METPKASLRTGLKEGLQLLEAAGTAAVRAGKLLKFMHESKITVMKVEWEEAVEEAIGEILKVKGPKWIGM